MKARLYKSVGQGLCVAVLVTVPALAWAADKSGATKADAAASLRQVESALQQKRAAADVAARAAADATFDLDKLQRKLRAAAAKETKREQALETLQKELDKLQQETAAAEADLAATAKTESGALGVMVRLVRTPPAIWWLNDGVTLDQERRMLLLRAAIGGLDVRAAVLRGKLATAEKLRTRLEAKRKKTSEARIALGRQQDELNDLIVQRQAFATRHLARQDALLREADKLAASAADLHALLNKLARQEAARRPRHRPVPDRDASGGDGGMLLPVAGKLTQGFGDRDSYGVKSRGATLRARPGARVVAPWSGTVVFAGPFKGYGSILILRHANDYHSLLAGFGHIDVRVGQAVTAGEPVGVMGLAQQGQEAELYFELRHDGATVDPLTTGKARKRPA